MNASSDKTRLRLVGGTWLSDSTLLIVGSISSASAAIQHVSLIRDNASVELEVRWSTYPRTKPNETKSTGKWLMVARASVPIRDKVTFGLSFSSDGETWLVDATAVASALTDLKALTRNEFAALDPIERAFIVEFLVSSAIDATEDESADRIRLSRSLNLIRDVLRERSPLCELSASRIEGLSVEAVMALDEVSFCVEGWMCDVESSAVRLTAVSPEGARTEIQNQLFRYERPDAAAFFKAAVGDQPFAKYGFMSYFRIDAPSLLPKGWLLEMETAAGTMMETGAPPAITSYNHICAHLLGELVHDAEPHLDLLRMHLSPAISALQLHRNSRVQASDVAQFGRQAPNPAVSILVPLYGRIDLLEHQMAHFADDVELRGTELIYILDSPELRTELLRMAERLYRLYGLPIRVIVLSENGGFSIANNIAASFARGRLLLLLNSDVVPREAGWLSKMVTFYESLERPGAVGPKLLYEDDSLQHAGLFFERQSEARTWTNEHYYKGLHSDLPAANVVRRVPAVTAACLMIEAQLYGAVGGLSGAYVQGDYEDSDLCLRLLEAGRENWYFPGAVLYHLEAQSYPTATRRVNREYNRWLFNETWADQIENVSAEFALLNGKSEPTAAPPTRVVRHNAGVKASRAHRSTSRESKDTKGVTERVGLG